MVEVWLVGVGRNLNRAVRTCAAFGVSRLVMLNCDEAWLTGNVYSAAGKVEIVRAETWPDAAGTLALETYATMPIREVPWEHVQRIVIGGETAGLPRGMAAEWWATIPQVSGPGLTVEAALAIALYEAS